MAATPDAGAHDEEPLVVQRPHPAVIAGPTVLVVAAFAGAVAIGIEFPQAPVAVVWVLAAMVGVPALWLLVRVVRWRTTRLVVTPSRLVCRRGVLGRDVVQLRLQRVAEVHCTQSLLDRLIGRGRLVLEVAGDDAVMVDDVRRPRSLQRLIARCLDELDAAGIEGPRPARPSAAGGWQAPPTPFVPPAGPPGPAQWEGAHLSDTPPHGTRAIDEPATAQTMPTYRPGDARVVALASPPAAGPGAAAGVVPGELPADDVPARLIALDELRRRGILSDQEFAAKKTELLSRL